MTAHVFIVGDQTFPLHLRYQFAGIGRGDTDSIDFNASAETRLHYRTENTLVRMIGDVDRIRAGDCVIFYLQSAGGNEGRFYGIFRAAGDAFIDNSGADQFLKSELGKSLMFRVLIKPEEVYSQGVTEWDALDSIRQIEKPNQMLWSLIYRKLKGNRGCTMITKYEEDRLCHLIRQGQRPLPCADCRLDFDVASREIAISNGTPQIYGGSILRPSLLPRIFAKASRKNQFEGHLQTHIVGNFGRDGDELTRLLLNDATPEWLGNEVGCGVGMQSIDVVVSYRKDQFCYVMPIELKTRIAKRDNIRQIRRYVDWIKQYYIPIPNLPIAIAPVLIAKKDRRRSLPTDFVNAVNQFNRDNRETENGVCESLRLIEFKIDDGSIRYAERAIR